MSNGFVVPRSTQALIYSEREKMLNNAVKLIGRLSEEVVVGMAGGNSGGGAVMEASGVESLEQTVERVIEKKFASVLHDIDYRIKTLYDAADRLAGVGDKVGSRDLNLAHHMIDGYTFTDNSPVAGSIAWAGCHIVYKGTDYVITDGNTASKYVWWDFSAVPNTVFQTSATKPALTADDVLVAINDGGAARVMLVPGKMLHGGAMLDGTVNSSEIGSSAVTSDKLAALSVIEGKLADSAVTANKLGGASVTSAKLATGAVVAGKLADGAVDASTRFAAGVVNSTALGSGAVVAGKIATGGVSAASQFAAGVVDVNALGAGAVTTAKIGDGQVIGAKIGAGSVAEGKLNLATHLLY